MFFTERLKFRPTPVNAKLELGMDQKIYCKADGREPPSVRWVQEGSWDLPGHVEDLEGTLHFKTVEYADAGKYTCIASSKQGSINATIQVDVVGRYFIISDTEKVGVILWHGYIMMLNFPVKPKFKIKPQNTTAYEGYPVMIHCVATGDPEPTIHWDKNNQVNGFDVRRFKVSGKYLCSKAGVICSRYTSISFDENQLINHLSFVIIE